MTDEEDEGQFPPEVVELPYDGELDLHLFHPKDVPELLAEYLGECRRRGVLDVRIIHGKGTGAQRRRVQETLAKLPDVERSSPAGEKDGGWGATWVRLLPP